MSEEKEYFYDFPKLPRLTLLPWLFWLALALLAIWATKAYSAPVLQVKEDDVTVVLFDEKCDLTDKITNLPYKAAWEEKGKVFRGCWGPRPHQGLVLVYFEDKTVGVIPLEALTRVRGA